MITQVDSTFPISHMYKQVSLCENVHKCEKLGIGHTLSNQWHVLVSKDLAPPQKCNAIHHLINITRIKIMHYHSTNNH
jgi:hypothetical protein